MYHPHCVTECCLTRIQMETNLVGHLLELVDDADRNQDGKIDLEEWKIMGMLLRAFLQG